MILLKNFWEGGETCAKKEGSACNVSCVWVSGQFGWHASPRAGAKVRKHPSRAPVIPFQEERPLTYAQVIQSQKGLPGKLGTYHRYIDS